MLNQIIKKLTSTNISKMKLQQIANILGIKTPDDSKFLSQIKADQDLDEIKLKEDIALLKSLPTPTTQLTWVEHTKQYAQDHKLSYKDALKQAGSTYNKKQKVKVIKKDKEKTEYICQFCNYKTHDKSNYNRHMLKHNNKKKLILDLVRARGLIRTHETRAEKSKNKDVREASQKILKQALETKRIVTITLLQIENESLKEGTKSTVDEKSNVNILKAVPKYAIDLIKRLNESYEDNTGGELELTTNKVTEFKQDGENIFMKVKKMIVDDDEQIDSIQLEYDPQLLGYNVSLMQDEDIKGVMKSIDYDSWYMY